MFSIRNSNEISLVSNNIILTITSVKSHRIVYSFCCHLLDLEFQLDLLISSVLDNCFAELVSYKLVIIKKGGNL